MYPRFVERRIREALTDTRVVLLTGPRQSGKTTLAQKLAGEEMVFLTLDNATTLNAASTDPVGFVRGLDRAIIDEIQRAPDLLLAIKESVDNDPRPGRFLLTGSSNLMTLPRVADSLAGRMETVRLLPLAQSEILGKQPSYFADAFSDRTPAVSEAIVGDDLIERVLAGSYPEGLAHVPLRVANVGISTMSTPSFNAISRTSRKSNKPSRCPACCVSSPNIPASSSTTRALVRPSA